MRLSVICVVTAFMTTLGCNHNQEGGHGPSGSPAAANDRVSVNKGKAISNSNKSSRLSKQPTAHRKFIFHDVIVTLDRWGSGAYFG